jgi:hypothetical protein
MKKGAATNPKRFTIYPRESKYPLLLMFTLERKWFDRKVREKREGV